MGFRDCVEYILYGAFVEKVNKGIKVNSPNGNRLAVAMHPYFQNKGNRGRMDDFIKNYEGPVLIFEEVTKIGNTYDFVKNLDVKGNRHFVITAVCSPYPFGVAEDKWENVLERVNSLRNERPVDLTGGYFEDKNRPSHWGGCLGVFASMLRHNKIPINLLEDLIFSRKDN